MASAYEAHVAEEFSCETNGPKAGEPLAGDMNATIGKHLELLGLALQRQKPIAAATNLPAPFHSSLFEENGNGWLGPAVAESTQTLAKQLSSHSSFRPAPLVLKESALYPADSEPRNGGEVSSVASHDSQPLSSAETARGELGSPGKEVETFSETVSRKQTRKRSSSSSSSFPVLKSTARWDDLKNDEDKKTLERIVTGWHFEMFFACLILVNTIVMIVEEQYLGSIKGAQIGWYSPYGSPEYNDTYMPAAEETFKALEIVFAGIFTIEAVMRMCGRGCEYWKDRTELMDLFVVICSNISLMLMDTGDFDNISLFRLLRLAKLLRIVKLIRTVEQLDSLQLMTTALYASINALCWAVVLLFIMQSFVALILTNIFRMEYLDKDSLSDEGKTRLFEYFGTYARAMLSTFELMLANWPPICRFLTEELHEAWMVVVIVYKLTFGFAFVGVINAVFMQETLNVAVTDDNIMIKTRIRAAAVHRTKMEKLLKLADVNKDGYLSLPEFEAVLENEGVKAWLESMDMDTRDAALLFSLIDRNGRGRVSVDELTRGFGKLKGIAKSVDTQLIIHTLMKQWFPDTKPAQGAKSTGHSILLNEVSSVFSSTAHHSPVRRYEQPAPGTLSGTVGEVMSKLRWGSKGKPH